MALHWNIERCNDFESLKSDSEWFKTEALIWTTMIIGINQITEKTADEFYRRVKLIEKGTGRLAATKEGDYWFTKEDITRRIGLGTNATSMNKTEFNKHLLKLMERE
jgi:hypothetical protein